MNLASICTLAQVQRFLQGTPDVQFTPLGDDAQRYRHIAETVQRLGYGHLGRADRGLVLHYLRVTCGYSRAQVTRLVGRCLNGEALGKRYTMPAHAFARRYSPADVLLLAEVDRQFDTLSGPATCHVLRRAWSVYRDPRFERLAGLSVAHLYNLRKTRAYREQRVSFTKTRATANSIGVRRAPAPQGRPGFVRVDSVHQGDLDGIKGVYHINAVDCVTQWEIVACCERISEAFLLPVLEQLIEQFPFRVLGFHADNGSEYINHTVARLLNKLNAEFTKSRPRHSNDNALAETKNGVVVRKFFGYSHIPQRFASRINEFCRLHLNPYLNLHRPCLFAAETPDPAKPGRIRKTYPHNLVQTPLEKLASLPNVAEFLKPNTPLHALLQRAHSCTDLQAAADLNAQRMLLFESFKKRSVRSA